MEEESVIVEYYVKTVHTGDGKMAFFGRYLNAAEIIKTGNEVINQQYARLNKLRAFGSTESEVDDAELRRYRPESVERLCQMTQFTRKEIQLLYRGFKQGSPRGIVSVREFRDIYQQFFPQGDSTRYARYVFNTFDQDHNGQISFEEFALGLAVLAKGNTKNKLDWIFRLSDMMAVISSIYELMGKHTLPPIDDFTIADHAKDIFTDSSVSKSLENFTTRLHRSPI